MAEQSTNNPPRHLTSPNATIHSIYVPVTKLDRYEQCTDPAHRLRGTHLTIDDGFPYADKQAEENMEIVVESYFRAHVATMGPNSGPEHPFRAFNVLVDESFLPDPTLQCGGFISQVTSLYTEGTTHADNRWRMYTILCHAEDLGLVILHEDEVNIATRTERTQGWDEDLKCDQNCEFLSYVAFLHRECKE